VPANVTIEGTGYPAITVEGTGQVSGPVVIELPGEPGPRGPTGGERLEFDIGIPSDTWGPFTHNLDQYPPVVLVTTQGDEFLAEIDYPDRNTVVAHLDNATAGKMSVG
jgi:hypothetical protein